MCVCVLVGGVGAGGCSHRAIPALKMNRTLTVCTQRTEQTENVSS